MGYTVHGVMHGGLVFGRRRGGLCNVCFALLYFSGYAVGDVLWIAGSLYDMRFYQVGITWMALWGRTGGGC